MTVTAGRLVARLVDVDEPVSARGVRGAHAALQAVASVGAGPAIALLVGVDDAVAADVSGRSGMRVAHRPPCQRSLAESGAAHR